MFDLGCRDATFAKFTAQLLLPHPFNSSKFSISDSTGMCIREALFALTLDLRGDATDVHAGSLISDSNLFQIKSLTSTYIS